MSGLLLPDSPSPYQGHITHSTSTLSLREQQAAHDLQPLVDQLLPPSPPPCFPNAQGESAGGMGLAAFEEAVSSLQNDMSKKLADISHIQESASSLWVGALVVSKQAYEDALKYSKVALKLLRGTYHQQQDQVEVTEDLNELGEIERSFNAPWKSAIESLRQAICDQLSVVDPYMPPHPIQLTEDEKVLRQWEEDSYVIVEEGAPAVAAAAAAPSLEAVEEPLDYNFLEQLFFKLKKNREAKEALDDTSQATASSQLPIDQRTLIAKIQQAAKLYAKGKYAATVELLKPLSISIGKTERSKHLLCYELGQALSLLGRALFKLGLKAESQDQLLKAEKVFWEILNLENSEGYSLLRDLEIPTLSRLACTYYSLGHLDKAVDLFCLCNDHFHLGALKNQSLQGHQNLFDPTTYVYDHVSKSGQERDKGDAFLSSAAKKCLHLSHLLKKRSIDAQHGFAGGAEKYYQLLQARQPIPQGSEKEREEVKQLEEGFKHLLSAAFTPYASLWAPMRNPSKIDPNQLDARGFPKDFWIEINMGYILLSLHRIKMGDMEDRMFTYDVLVRNTAKYAPNLSLLLKFTRAALYMEVDADGHVLYLWDLYRALTGLEKNIKVTKEHVEEHIKEIKAFSKQLHRNCLPIWGTISYNLEVALERAFNLSA